MNGNRTITCIACPRGCRLELVSGEEGGLPEVKGYGCPRGIKYGLQEAQEPLRMLTSTVKTCRPEKPRLPVRLSGPVPLDRFTEIMALINAFLAENDCRPGDVLSSDFGMPGIDLIATGGLGNEQ